MPAGWRAGNDLLRDRVVLITGAAGGIGRSLALAAGRLGATVILLDKTIAGLESVYDEIENQNGPTPAIYPLNLEGATPGDYAEMASTVGDNFGRLDGLVNNAAFLGALTPIRHLEPELWQQVLQTNLSAPYALTQSCLELLNASNDASVIFSTDTVARTPRAYWGAYAVSKAGLESFAGVLADEAETNASIRYNCVDPGPVATAIRTIAYPGENHSTLKNPEDVLDPYLYLLGPDSSGITGTRILSQSTDQASARTH